VSGAARRALVVVNPAAGGSPATVAGTVIDELARADYTVASLLTTRPGGAVATIDDMLRRDTRDGESVELIVAVGGDGTVHEVAEGIVRGCGRWPGARDPAPLVQREGPTLFVAPGGTGNSFYRALFGDTTLEEALRLVLDDLPTKARRRWLDIGRLVEHDQAVVLGASAGFLASVLEAARASSVIGRPRYEQAAVELLGRSDELGTNVRVLVDGQLLVEGEFLLVALGGARHRGGWFELLPDSVLDDGLFDVCAIATTSPARLGELLVEVIAGTHLDEPEVTSAKGRTVIIETLGPRPTALEVDGDVLDFTGTTPRTVTFDVVDNALAVWSLSPPPAG
jgi:diacylglycerol kinase (ATP)